MLPNPALRKVYEDIVWLYVYRDFSNNVEDRAAERISLRFGVTSWPQHFLVDPQSLTPLANTGRAVDSFLRATQRSKVKPARSFDALKRQLAAEKRADALERSPSVKAAVEALSSDDIILRYTGLRVLAKSNPKRLVAQAEQLLAVPNDPFRYEVCAVLRKAEATGAAHALEAVVMEPKNSRNPNVLRIRAVSALAVCGDADSVPVIGKWATTGAYFNGLTGVSVDALATLKGRHKGARKAVDKLLRRAYPKPVDPADNRGTRACVALAKRVHKALGSKRAFPKVYDEAARKKLARQ